MISLLLAIAFFAVLTLANYWVQRSILYPPFIFCSMWLLDLVLYQSGWIDVDPLHTNTLVIVEAGAAMFSFGGLLASLLPKSLLKVHIVPYNLQERSNLVRNTLTALVLCGLPLYFYQVLQLSSAGTGTGFLMKARAAQLEALQNGEPIHSLVLDYFFTFSVLVSLLFAIEKRDLRFWVVTTAAFLGAILSTGRTSLLLLISALSAVYLIQVKRESMLQALKFLRWPVALFFCLYVILIFTNKSTEDYEGSAASIAVYFVLSYIVGPLAAFDGAVQAPGNYMALVGPTHIFIFFFKFFSALHLVAYNSPSPVDSFVFVPFPTNVYTMYLYYFLELGVAGTLAVMVLFGMLHSFLYLKARQGSKLSTYLFGYAMYAVLLAIFDDAYYEIGGYLRATVFALVYFALCKIDPTVFSSRLTNVRDQTSKTGEALELPSAPAR